MTATNPVTLPLAQYQARHFRCEVNGKVATLTLNRPERKNPFTFDSYQEMTDIFRAAVKDDQVKAIVVTGAGGNFSSGGDVFEIIGPLVAMGTTGLMARCNLPSSPRRTKPGSTRCCRPLAAANADGLTLQFDNLATHVRDGGFQP